MDRRPAELDATKKLVEFLCINYSDLLAMEEYTHPVKGVCTALVIKPYSYVSVDISNIMWIKFDIHDNELQILTSSPGVLYNMKNFIKDGTVM